MLPKRFVAIKKIYRKHVIKVRHIYGTIINNNTGSSCYVVNNLLILMQSCTVAIALVLSKFDITAEHILSQHNLRHIYAYPNFVQCMNGFVAAERIRLLSLK